MISVSSRLFGTLNLNSMARGDFHPYDTRGAGGPISTRYRVEGDTDATIVAGEMLRVDQGSSDTEYVQLEVDGGSNTTVKIGVAASDSDEDSSPSTDGNVWAYDNPLYLFKGRATTASNLAASVRLTQVTMDVAAGTNGRMTIDEDDTTNGTYRIFDFDATTGTVVFALAMADSIIEG